MLLSLRHLILLRTRMNTPLVHSSLAYLLTLCFSALSTVLVAQVQAYGVVKEYRGVDEKVPLSGVQVSVMNATSAVSGNDGRFSLQFRTLHPGDLVKVRRIEKQGYEIFNKEALEQWIISGRQDIPFTIVMCPVARFKQMRDNYERVSSANYEAQFQKEKAQLAKRRDAGQISQPQYEKAVQRATTTLQQSKAQVAVVAEKFSRIDLSEVSSAEREVIGLVQQGKIEQAIITAEERGNMLHMAELYQLAGGVENMEKADSLLRKVAWSDTTQLNHMQQFAEFAYRQGDYTSACQAYELCMRHIGTHPAQQAPMAHNLGLLYMQLRDIDRAQRMILQSIEGFQTLYKRDPEGWAMSLLSARLSLATLQLGQNQIAEALTSYQDVCASCEAVLKDDSTHQEALRQWVKAENNMAVLYMRQKKYTEAQQVLRSALMHAQRIEKGELESAGICHSLGTLYMTTGHLSEAETRLKQCERLLLPLMARNPQSVMPDLARCYYNLYRLCHSQEERQADANRYLDTAIRQYEILAERQPQTYAALLKELNKLKAK